MAKRHAGDRVTPLTDPVSDPGEGGTNLAGGKITVPGREMKKGRTREVTIHPALARFLKSKLRGRSESPATDPVIGKTVTEIKDAFQAAQRRAEIPSTTWRSLRRTFASWLRSSCSCKARRCAGVT